MLIIGKHCDKCVAPVAQEVELYGQDFYFCQHHFNELEPVFIGIVERELASA